MPSVCSPRSTHNRRQHRIRGAVLSAAIGEAARMSPPGGFQARFRPRQSTQMLRTGRDALPGFFGLLFFDSGVWLLDRVARSSDHPDSLFLALYMRHHGGPFVNPFLPATFKNSRQSTQLHFSRVLPFLPGTGVAETSDVLGWLYWSQACPDPYAGTPWPRTPWRADRAWGAGAFGECQSGTFSERHDDDASIARSTVQSGGIHSLDR